MSGSLLTTPERTTFTWAGMEGPGGPRAATMRAILFAAGIAIFAGLIWQVGPEKVLAYLRPLGWTVVLAIPPYFLVFVLDSLGWRYVLDRSVPPSLARLTGIHMVGKAVNLITPLAPVGGEPVKAYLLEREGVPLAEGLASVVVSRTVATIAQGLFVVGVMGFTFFSLGLPGPLLRALLAAVVVGALLVGIFLLTQVRGLFGGLLGILGRVGLGLPSLEAGARGLDRRILESYRQRSGRLLAALAFNLASWLTEGVEVYVLLTLLGLSRSVILAMGLAAFSSAIRAASFFIPGSLGVQEGGNVFLFVSLGLPPDAALAFSILRRLREAIWAATGFLLLSWYGPGRLIPLPAVTRNKS